MKHFILDKAPDADGSVRISGKDFNYLVNVRRLRPGKTLDCLLPSGEMARLLILGAERGVLHAQCLAVITEAPEKAEAAETALNPSASNPPADGTLVLNTLVCPPITLFQAMPTGAKMDAVVRMAGEAGVSEIAPFYSARSVKSRGGAIEVRLDRWRRVLKEARQQSGSRAVGTVRAPVGLDGLLSYWESVREPGASASSPCRLPKKDFTCILKRCRN
jgi:16S rRNA (uracil1498-N3)-methyltransferase